MRISAVLLLAAVQATPPPAFEVGPALGETIPAFQALDQDGRLRSFADLRGPKGLVLLFFRSADW
ncbi:MAG TPA: hypothetical protein VGL15_04390 [Vicinamibacteria bacterium]|jgi:hypothetical protein